MKKFLLSLMLVIGLQGAPAPAQASNGMTDIISTMMQMFMWMMSGGGGLSSGFNPYSMSPYGAQGMQGFPAGLGGLSSGSYGSLGRSPYSQYGYAGGSPYNGAYYDPYTGQPIYSRHDSRRPYSDPYHPAYDAHRQEYPKQQKSPSVVIQPIIVSSGEKADGLATPKVEVLSVTPVQTIPPAQQADQTRGNPYATVPAAVRDAYDAPSEKNALAGRWQGMNGEFMELIGDNLFLRTQDSELRGTYQLNNGIMKISVQNGSKPAYMQYQLEQGKLAFRSEAGQMMLFRRIY